MPHLAPARVLGDLIFTSGQLGYGDDGRLATGIDQQVRACLKRLGELLAAHGSGLDDIVKTTIWLRNAEDFTHFDAVYAEILGNNRPARSTLVCSFPKSEVLIEIEAIAKSNAQHGISA